MDIFSHVGAIFFKTVPNIHVELRTNSMLILKEFTINEFSDVLKSLNIKRKTRAWFVLLLSDNMELLLSSDVLGCMLSLNCYFRLMYQGVCCHWTATFIWCIRVYVVIEQNCYFHLMYQGVCCQLLLSSDVSGCMLALNCCFCLMYQGVCWHWTAAFDWCIRVYT